MAATSRPKLSAPNSWEFRDQYEFFQDYTEVVDELDIRDELQPVSAYDLPTTPQFVVTTSPADVLGAAHLFKRFDVQQVYDLGAGDFRASAVFDALGFDVVAYEIREELATNIPSVIDLSGVEIRIADYFESFDEFPSPDTAICAFGGRNKLPTIPAEGLVIHGYAESGVRTHYDGEEVEWGFSDARGEALS